MAAPPIAAPLLARLAPHHTTPSAARHDVICLTDDGEEVKEQPPRPASAAVPMQLDGDGNGDGDVDDDDDVQVIASHSAVAVASVMGGSMGGGGSGGGVAGRNGYSLVSSLKEKLFGGWNNNNASHTSSSQPPPPASHMPLHSSTQLASSSSSSAAAASAAASSQASSSSCGSFSLCSPSSSSASHVMKRQKSNDDMGVVLVEPAVVRSGTPSPPVPPPRPSFHLAPTTANTATSSPPQPHTSAPPVHTTSSALPSASTSTSPSSPSSASSSLAFPAPVPAPAPLTSSLTAAMSDEELARYLQAEDEAADRRRRQQRQQAEEADFQRFQRDQGTCTLCHTEVGTELILELAECGHRTCADCLRAHLLRWNGSGSVTCPCGTAASGRCGVIVPERMMRQVLTTEQLDELQQRQMKAFLTASSSSYVTCPSCHETFEAIPTSSASTSATSTPRASVSTNAGKETAEDGRELTAEQIEHRNRHRYRCVSCSANFCRLCQITPYHLGYTCDEYQRYTNAPHCRYCEDVLLDPPITAASSTAAASLSSSSSSSSAASTATSFVSRILRSNSKKEDLLHAITAAPPKPANVCGKAECLDKYANQCIKLLPTCKHPCDGIRGERQCLPCLYDGCDRHRADGPSRDEFCNICYAETLGSAPCIQLRCSHVFHHGCIKTKLEKRWPTPRVTFYFMNCPLCNAQIDHPALAPTLAPLLALRQQVQQKASDRLTFEGNHNDPPLHKGGKYEGRPADYAMDLYAYYMCSHCHQPYFGGRRQCEEAAAARGEESYNEKDLVCGGCVMTEGGGNGCAKHGKEFIEYKCKWCCNIATWFCWGNTHFCADCHKRQEQGEYLTRKRQDELPQCDGAKCPLGVKHPPNGTEFALGCGICRQRQTF